MSAATFEPLAEAKRRVVEFIATHAWLGDIEVTADGSFFTVRKDGVVYSSTRDILARKDVSTQRCIADLDWVELGYVLHVIEYRS